jgi:hypothetical protein
MIIATGDTQVVQHDSLDACQFIEISRYNLVEQNEIGSKTADELGATKLSARGARR